MILELANFIIVVNAIQTSNQEVEIISFCRVETNIIKHSEFSFSKILLAKYPTLLFIMFLSYVKLTALKCAKGASCPSISI